jgi:hypothetical protein
LSKDLREASKRVCPSTPRRKQTATDENVDDVEDEVCRQKKFLEKYNEELSLNDIPLLDEQIKEQLLLQLYR